MSGKKVAPLWQKNRNAESSDDEGTMEPSSFKKVKVSAIAITPHPLISESEPMDVTSTGKARVAEEMVDTMSRIIYKVDFDQCDLELY
jgi:hypothetical protein